MFPPALAIQQANDAVPGTVPKIPAGGRVLATNAQGTGAFWADPASAFQVEALMSTSSAPILAVPTPPGWNVCGAFIVPSSGTCVLAAIGLVSDPSLEMDIRLYCTSPGHVGPVPGSLLELISTIDQDVISDVFALPGPNLRYQVQAQVWGNSGVSYFGTLRRAAPQGV